MKNVEFPRAETRTRRVIIRAREKEERKRIAKKEIRAKPALCGRGGAGGKARLLSRARKREKNLALTTI